MHKISRAVYQIGCQFGEELINSTTIASELKFMENILDYRMNIIV